MQASDVSRAFSLTNHKMDYEKAIELIDAGAIISAFTLKRPVSSSPPAPEPDSPSPAPEPDEEGTMPPEETPEAPPGPDQPTEPEGAGELTVSAEGVSSPPQMITAIRQQLQMRHDAIVAQLAAMGVTA